MKMIIPPKELIENFKQTPGAFSVAEMIALYNIILDAPRGVYGELGTHKGKSAIPMVSAMSGNEIVLVEPEFKDEKWLADTVTTIQKSINNKIYILPIAGYSIDILPSIGEFAYILVDSGSHGDGLPIAEAKLLEDKIIPGGIIAFHDFRNQFKEPKEASEYLVSTGKYEWVEIDWKPILDYVKENNLEEGNNSWHQYPELGHPPNFLGAIKRKISE